MEIQYELPKVISTLQIVGCHIGETEPNWSYPWHHHYLFELLYCKNGTIKQTVGQDSFYLTSGDWLLIKSGISHATENVGLKPYKFFNLHFDLDDVEIRKELCKSNYIVIHEAEAERVQLKSYYTQLEAAIHIMSDSTTSKLDMALHQLTIQSSIIEIISRMLTCNRDSKSVQLSTSIEQTNKNATLLETELAHAIEQRIKENHKIQINEIARALGITRSRCTLVFTKVFGQSPRQYVSRLILNQAKHLLVQSTLTIDEIAEQLEFQSASHFSRQFRRWTGMAPSHFRPKYVRSNKNEDS